MADYQQKGDLDYRRGGDTLSDFGEMYDAEIPWIFEILNTLRANRESTASRLVEPVACQLKIEDGHIYIRNAENSAWVHIGEVSYALGLIAEGTRALSSVDLAAEGGTAEQNAGKIPVLNEDGIIPFSTNRIAGKRVDTSEIADGLVMVYRESANTFVFEAKGGGIGEAKSLTVMDGSRVVGRYDGSSAVTLDLPFHMLARSTRYSVGEIVNTPAIPSNMRLECITAGVTGAELPEELQT